MTRFQIVFAVLCFLAALSLVMMAPAFAQTPNMCGDHAKLIKVLKDKYQETGTAIGIAGETSLIEVYTAPDGATWTIVSTQPNGYACIIAAGKDWMEKKPEIPGRDS